MKLLMNCKSINNLFFNDFNINPVFILFMIRLLSINLFFVLSVGLSAQSVSDKPLDELEHIANKYQLSDTQKSQVARIIQKRDQDLIDLKSNQNLDEPQRILKRSSIINGFEGSLQLTLNSNQVSLANKKNIEQREMRIAEIEALKKKGLTQAEILKQLDNKLKSH